MKTLVQSVLALVRLGSITGTIQQVIEKRSDPVKLVRPRVIRPFPAEALRDALSGTEALDVLQKEVSSGYQGSFVGELKSAYMPRTSVPSSRATWSVSGSRCSD